MIIYIFGEDTFRSRQYLREQVEKFKAARDPQGYNVVFIDGQQAEAGKVLSEISAAPFLAEKRLIVLENILSSNDKSLLGELVERIRTKKTPESSVVIFWQGETAGKTKEAKELEALLRKEKYAREFAPLSGVQLRQWAAKEIIDRGGKIEPAALAYLVQNADDDMWRLSTLCDQLVAWTGEPVMAVTTTDVQMFLEEKIDDSAFGVVEAIANGDRKKAFKLIQEQRRLGEDEMRLSGLIVWQFRTLIMLRSLYEAEDKLTSDAMAKRLGTHPFVVKKNFALVRRYKLDKLKFAYQRLLEIEAQTKTGLGDQSLLLDLFIGEA